MDHAVKGTPSGEQEGLDSGWPAFLAAARAADPNFEDYGVARLAGDYARLGTKIIEAVRHATGHTSEELFKIGYMLSIIQERTTYTLDDLAHVVSSSWVMPTGDLDIVGRVRDIMYLPCNFAEELNQSGFRDFINHIDNLDEVQSFLRRLDYVRTHPGRLPRLPTLSVSETKAVLCAEIWCTWAYENRCPLPSEVAFVELFGAGMTVKVTEFGRRLETAFACAEFKEYILRWYGFDVAILRNMSALDDLVDSCDESIASVWK
ncbi:hypothetical protein F5B22DRAFT_601765 [Xylaria bambusicola]|uniref:uncharacterized protein n=1 Tax=Xylaria bambusicola TaxID=326684 RepID=UPI00200835CC|nr:uncharacterized protein F5B22DRAFT_601765 [Xylaria bambusicola]KAI0518116.1 hypothetical protein F5B22DRAFT_601765 [Xylaria bambusicola]